MPRRRTAERDEFWWTPVAFKTGSGKTGKTRLAISTDTTPHVLHVNSGGFYAKLIDRIGTLRCTDKLREIRVNTYRFVFRYRAPYDAFKRKLTAMHLKSTRP